MKINGRNQTFTYARVCWFLHYGVDLSEHVDHVDLDKSNHRLSNLRDASKSTNGMNRVGVSGRKHDLPKNVYLHKGGPRVRVSVRVDYKTISGGVFNSVPDAVIAAEKLRATYHRSFAHG